MEHSVLQDLGLTEGEIKVYLALLETGASSTGNISRRAGVHTSKVYPILDRLIDKGLAAYIYRKKTRLYQAVAPTSILELIQNKRKELDSQEEEVRKLVKQLETTELLTAKQWAAVFEGRKGIQSLFEIMLDEWQPGEDYLVLAPGNEYADEELNKFFKKHHLKRLEKGVKVKSLAHTSQREFYEKDYKDVPGFEYRFTDITLPAATNIVHNKVAILIWGAQPTAFVIDSEQTAQQYREFFRTVWERADSQSLM